MYLIRKDRKPLISQSFCYSSLFLTGKRADFLSVRVIAMAVDKYIEGQKEITMKRHIEKVQVPMTVSAFYFCCLGRRSAMAVGSSGEGKK